MAFDSDWKRSDSTRLEVEEDPLFAAWKGYPYPE